MSKQKQPNNCPVLYLAATLVVPKIGSKTAITVKRGPD